MPLITKLRSADNFGVSTGGAQWFSGAFYRNRYFVGARGVNLTSGQLWIIDYNDPDNPVAAAQIAHTYAVGGTSARSKGLAVVGDSVFMVSRSGAGSDPGYGIIQEFDITVPTSPVATVMSNS